MAGGWLEVHAHEYLRMCKPVIHTVEIWWNLLLASRKLWEVTFITFPSTNNGQDFQR